MPFYLFAENTFNAAHRILVFAGNECEGIPGLCSPAGAADTVCVGVGGVGDVVVDDVGYERDINAAGSNIGGNKNLV